MIHARRGAQEDAAQVATDWNRYNADQAYHDQLDEQERIKREMEAQRERTSGERR
jgi:hypothetical protein